MSRALVAVALCAASVMAQDRARLVFPSSAELVRVVVSVTDPAGRPIRGLRREDFTLRDDGRKREISSTTECDRGTAGTPTDCEAGLVLLFDTSHSMDRVLEQARYAAAAFVASVPEARSRDVISFESDVRFWPGDPDQLGSTLDLILLERTGFGTRFYEAVVRGAERASADSSARPILVALTDGDDTEETLRRGAAMRNWTRGELREDLHDIRGRDPKDIAVELQKSGVAFYAISFAHTLARKNRRESAQKALNILAERSGGLIVDGSDRDLNTQFERIRGDLASQYVLGFVPTATARPGELRKLKIEVRDKTARVRHRAAYAMRR